MIATTDAAVMRALERAADISRSMSEYCSEMVSVEALRELCMISTSVRKVSMCCAATATRGIFSGMNFDV